MGKTSSNSKNEPGKPGPSTLRSKERTITVHMAEAAWRVAVPFMLFSLGGIWLDTKFDKEPLFTLIGIILAIFSISIVVYKYVDKNFPDTFKSGKDDKK